MKTITLTALIVFTLLTFLTSAFAVEKKDNEKMVDMAKKGYLKMLESKNPLLRHEGVCQLAQLKSQNPETDFSDCKKQLSQMAQKDEYYHLRDYATLALMYIQNELLNVNVKLEYKGDPTEFFHELHELAHLRFYEDIYFKDRPKSQGESETENEK